MNTVRHDYEESVTSTYGPAVTQGGDWGHMVRLVTTQRAYVDS